MESKVKVKVDVKKTFTMTLTAKDIITCVNLLRCGNDESPIPENADCSVQVPDGGDWSNEELGIDQLNPLTIQWREDTVEENEEDF